MQNPFADLIPQQPAQPGLIPLTPPPAPDPFKVRDQELQEEAAARAREDQGFQREKFRGEMAAREKERTADPKLVEAERTAAFLATRVAGGIADLNRYLRKNPDASKPAAGGVVAGIFGAEARNWANSPARRQIEAAQLDILDAALTLGTGAAYTPEQLAGYRESYFPRLTDDEETVREKQVKLRRLLEAARIKAGSAAPQIDEALAAVGGGAPAEQRQPVGPGDIGFSGKVPEEGNPLNPDQQRAYNAFVSANPNVTPDQLRAFGQQMGFPGEIANAEQIIEAAKQGAGFATASNAQIGRSAEQEAAIKDRVGRTDAAGSFAVGMVDSATLGFADEIAAGGGAVVDSLQGEGSFTDRYSRNIGVERGYAEALRDRDPVSSFAGQIAGGIALPGFGARSAGQLARLGAGYGAAYGAGSGEGITDRLIGAGTGAAVGGAAGGAFGLIGNHIAARAGGAGNGGRRADAIALMEAAQRQDINPLPADVGGPLTRRLTAGAAQSPVSAGTIIRGGQRVVDQASAARDRIAATAGTALDGPQAGEAAEAAARGYIGRSGTRGTANYDRAAELAGDARIDPARAREVLDRNIAELSQSPLGAPAALTNLRERLDGEFTVAGLRNLRTQLRDEFASAGLRGSDAERRGMQAVDGLTEDIAAGLTRQGRPEAAEAYQSADRFWRERLRVIDDVIEPIIGNGKSGEQVFQAIQGMTRTNSARLREFMRTIGREEASTVRASVINQLGRASPGTQNAEGNTFSLNQFLTQWNQMTPRAKGTLFRGETRAALDDLARVAQGSREAGGYANRSNTSGSQLGNVLTGGAGVAAWFEPLVLTAFATNYGAGRLLASPRFARFLARPPADRGRAARRLGQIGAREPAIAAEIAPIREALEAGITPRAAAEQERDRPQE